MEKATILLTVNFIFGAIFIVGMIITIVMMVRRDINDLFINYAMYCMILALALSAVMCFIVTSYDTEQYIDDQTVAWQQVYFEVPFYMFLIVIASILFSW